MVVHAVLSCEAPSYIHRALAARERKSYIAGLVAATAVVMEALKSLVAQLFPAEFLVFAVLPCGVPCSRSAPLRGFLLTQTYPANHLLRSRGSRQRGSTFLHRRAHGSDSRGHGSSQARRQERVTMMHQRARTKV
ncbi:uncharacterized protein N7484_005355 [Penicillium longicatenatum]|uniref:uncharacterized protein n=1 Tax=Penicillium longicatenatum TaxID=1561947 RepID=UPI0025498ED7|nr:uncharacterized protein N7484_005355 [Penicillium longicatenatum]KAJ5651632.1 hypothetical protein N7484_005355 [Penicillium longicatenatum]